VRERESERVRDRARDRDKCVNEIWLTNINGVIDGQEGEREAGRDGYAAKRALG
jgi:hypothetical protein